MCLKIVGLFLKFMVNQISLEAVSTGPFVSQFLNVPVPSGLLKLVGEALLGSQPHGRGLRWDSQKLVESCRGYIAGCIFIRSKNNNIFNSGEVAPEDDAGAFRVVFDIVNPSGVGVNLRLSIILRIRHGTTPEITLLEGLHVEASDDTKIGRSTLESKE